MLDHYTSEEIRGFYREDHNKWPQKFKDIIHVHLANELLDMWLESHDDNDYEERVIDMVENYGWLSN